MGKPTQDEGAEAPGIPVSNTSRSAVSSFSLSEWPLDAARLTAHFGDDSAGACVVFEGRVRNRNEGKRVLELEYEAYPRMAVREGEQVVAEALERFGVLRAECIHRLGRLKVGDLAVWVAVLAEHRDEGFAACRYIIDEVKSRVPIWKKEHYDSGGSSWVGGQPG